MQFGREEKVPQIKLTVVQYAILGIFLVLAYGLWRLQVVGSDKYEAQAERNRVRTVPILAPRGKILDREGRIIVDNYPSFSVLLLRDQVKNIEPDVAKIADGLDMQPAEVRDRVRRFAYAPAYEPLVLKDDITPGELAFIESHKLELPELETIMVHRRLYPKNGFLAHVIGYVGEVSDTLLNLPQFALYQPGMIVGQSGIEQQYNDMLMGKDGLRRAVVNSRGKEVSRLDEVGAEPGKQLKLTIDLDMQIAAEQALADKNGAIVAMDPHTGEILAMVSRPTFDPNAFAVHITRDEWNRLITDENKPLLNKAIQAQLAPGSTFKIIMSVAGLQEGIAQTLHVSCHGSAVFYGRSFGCWLKGGHGAVEVSKAIYQSCDVFFYTLAERLGIARIAQYATAFGLGKKTGIDLPQEASGLIPSEEWKIKAFKQRWYPSETINVGIGQGPITVTPVQLMRAIAAISMGGNMVQPHLVVREDSQPNLKQASDQPTLQRVAIDPNNWETITDAMSRVPTAEGTSGSAHLDNIDFAGKTGSAQVVSLALRAKDPNNPAYAQNGWFVGFTPRRSPDIVVGVLFQGGEHGKLAARLAAQVIKAFVDKHRQHDIELRRAAAPGASVPSLATIQDKYSPPRKPEAAKKDAAPVNPAKAILRRDSPLHRDGAHEQVVQMTGMWSGPGDELKSGRFRLRVANSLVAPVKAAPGMGGARFQVSKFHVSRSMEHDLAKYGIP